MACVRSLTVKTAAEWTGENPRLWFGVMGIESDTGKCKVNFTSGPMAWTSLDYFNPTGLSAQTHIADPTGAVTDQDDEARAAIEAILDLLEANGLMEPAP